MFYFLSTAELRYVEVVGTQKNTSTKEWFEITNWALWGAKLRVAQLKY